MEYLFFGDPAEGDAVLDSLLNPSQLDLREIAHGLPPSVSGNSRASSSRSMSATGMPRAKAAILMRPRSAGVMSMVSRAVKSSALRRSVRVGSGALTQASRSPGRAAQPP